MQFVRCEDAVYHGQQVDCCSCLNWLWIKPLCDGAVIPTSNVALIEHESASKLCALLPPMVEAILEHSKLMVMMSCVVWTAPFFVSIYLIPLIILLDISIIVEMEAVVHVLEHILWHVLHARTNCIK